MICPDCKTDNIQGTDFCEHCGHDLRNLDLPGAYDEFTYHLLNDRLGDLAGEEPPIVSPGDPVYYAIHKMQRQETGCVMVKEGDKLVGILTELDVLLKAAAADIDLNAVAVRDVMTPDPVVLSENDTLAVALHKMSVGGFRHIPLASDQDSMTRVISIVDVFHHVSPFIHGQPARVV